MLCDRCGAEMPAGFAFCCKCGAPRKEPEVCSNCGAEMPEEFGFCCKCGTPRKKPEPVVVAPVVEEPKVEEPVVVAPVVEEPKVEEPVVVAPVVEKPKVEEPVVAAPVVEEPKMEEPLVVEPVAVNTPSVAGKTLCPNCGSEVNNVFCTECGTRVEPAPVKEVKPVKEKKKKAGPTVGQRIGTILLSLCLVISLLAGMLVLSIRTATTEENLQKIVTQILEADPEALGSERDSTQQILVSVVYNAVYYDHGNEMQLTKEQVFTLMEESKSSEYISEKLTGYIRDYIYGTDETKVKSKEIVSLMRSEKNLLRKFGVEPTDAYFNKVQNMLDDADLDDIVEKQVFKEMDNTKINGMRFRELMDVARTIVSTPMLIAMLLCCVLWLTAIFVLNLRHVGSSIAATGWCVAIVGLILSLPALGIQVFYGLLPLPSLVINAMQEGIGSVALIYYLMLLGGIVLIVGGCLLSKLLNKKETV